MFPRIDLHTHSDCSDGLLSPGSLVALAAQRQVELLALTDHDTVSGCGPASVACAAAAIRFVPGIELSCQWREREIHIVGLQLDVAHAALLSHCGAVLALRRERIHAMTQRLSRAGLPGQELAALTLKAALPTRTHLARALCRLGVADSMQQAFERWLKRGRPGYVSAQWPQLATAVQRIVEAGGIAVLAHPHRYTDSHEPDLPWRPLGRFAKLPDLITPIAARLAP